MNAHSQFWREREVLAGKSCLWRLGSLRLWIQPVLQGWRVAAEYGQSVEQMNASMVPNDVVPSGLTWQQMALAKPGKTVQLRPQMPDRPLIARPEERVVIPAGEILTYYCLVPTWVRLLVSDERPAPLAAWPTRVLADTWFGDHANGILGYALAIPAGQDWRKLPIGPHHVVVPVRIENNSSENLDFERLCLRSAYLGIYGAAHELWSNAVTVSYHGSSRDSSVRYAESAPRETTGAVAIAPPHERAERSLVGITFSHPPSGDFRSKTT